MKKLLLALSMLVSCNAQADTWTLNNDGGGQIVLTQTVCSENTSTSIVFSQLKNGKTLFGCWFTSDGFVMVTWADGDVRAYPEELFVKKQGAKK